YPVYYQIIKNPICISDIRKRLASTHYRHPSQFRDDMRLMFDNAQDFNEAGSYVWNDADAMRKVFERVYAKACPAGELPPLPTPTPPPQPAAQSRTDGDALSAAKGSKTPAKQRRDEDDEDLDSIRKGGAQLATGGFRVSLKWPFAVAAQGARVFPFHPPAPSTELLYTRPAASVAAAPAAAATPRVHLKISKRRAESAGRDGRERSLLKDNDDDLEDGEILDDDETRLATGGASDDDREDGEVSS
ncbi:MAG: Bromodomain-containing protein, partial [Olpidium bornovanus]